MGENLEIDGRRAVRSPMQWSSAENGGFSTAPVDELVRPVPDGRFGPANVNARAQVRQAGSMFEWTRHLVRLRKQLPEMGFGEHRVLDAGRPEVLVLRFDWRGRTVVTLHNFSPEATVAANAVSS